MNLVIIGQVNTNANTADILRSYQAPTRFNSELQGAGDYVLRLFGGTGVVKDVPFTPVRIVSSGGDSGNMVFTVVTPAPNGLERIAILHNSSTLTSRVKTASAPQITLISPNGGETIEDEAIPVTWTTDGSGSENLEYIVQFSVDSGQNWDVLFTGLKTTYCELSPEVARASKNARIRVIASDGFSASIAESAFDFVVKDPGPMLAVFQPVDGSIWAVEREAHMSCYAYDLEDGEVSEENVIWQSEAGTVLAKGRHVALDFSNMSLGSHNITIVATDSAGNQKSVSRTIWLTQLDALAANIALGGGVQISWDASLEGYVLETATTLPAAEWTRIESPQIIGTRWSVTIQPEAKARFFRLRH